MHIDIETYSDVDLKKYGVYRYADSPNFKILLFAYAHDDGQVQIVDLANGEVIPDAVLYDLEDPSVTKMAFNAQFERVCIDKMLKIDSWPWECTMIHAAYLGLASNLDTVGRAVGIAPDQQKLSTGKNLIRLFSAPRKPTKANEMKTVYTKQNKPEEWEQFKTYCVTDVEAERAIEKKLSALPMPAEEKEIYKLDQRINDRGVLIDMDLATAATDLDAQQTKLFEDRYNAITGLGSPNKLGALKTWIKDCTGESVSAITKDSLPLLTEKFRGHPAILEALEIRQRLSRSSVAKYKAMAGLACEDGRAKGLFRFYGASTGRWAGRGIQPQNLPRNYLNDLDSAREVIRQKDLGLMEMLYDDPADVLSQCIRTAIIPAPGKKFLVADFSAIEARVIAWLAGESWRMDVFRSHGKIYEASAAQMFKVPVESIGKGSELRQKGKVAELALGYQGSVGALRQMGALDMGIYENELPVLVERWRAANPAIVRFWGDVEVTARQCIKTRQKMELQGLIFSYRSGILFIRLPSGRELAYPKAQVRPHSKFDYGEEIAYMELKNGDWASVSTYGGKLTENIVQAIARDCLAVSMLRVEAAGYPIVMHVHDEIVIESDAQTADADLVTVCDLMGEVIAWAPGLPLRADGFVCDYYQKD